jgi:hypothetical protein
MTIENNNQQTELKSRKSCFGIILTIIAVFAIAGGLLWHYAPHLHWKHAEWQMGAFLDLIERIPHSPMPEVSISDYWIEHSSGCVRFQLPPDMSTMRERGTSVVFCNEHFEARFSQSTADLNGILQTASRVHPEKKTFLTLSQLCLESLGVSAKDFRWSMSRQEAAWHTFIVCLRPLIVRPDTSSVESFSKRNWEGLLFRGEIMVNDYICAKRRNVHFQWYCTTCSVSGRVYFYSLNEGLELDINDDIRRIVQSIEVNCGCLQDTHDELQELDAPDPAPSPPSPPPPVRALRLDNTETDDAALADICRQNPELVELTLGGTKITDAGLIHLLQLKKLRKIRLSKTAITDSGMRELAKCETLEDVDVSQTKIGDDGVGELRALPRLKNLNLYLTLVTDAGLDSFHREDHRSAATIERLNLDKCPITDAGLPKLASLTNLAWLHLGGTAITDTGLAELATLNTLKEVIVTKTETTPEGIEQLRRTRPDLTLRDNISEKTPQTDIDEAAEYRQKLTPIREAGERRRVPINP